MHIAGSGGRSSASCGSQTRFNRLRGSRCVHPPQGSAHGLAAGVREGLVGCVSTDRCRWRWRASVTYWEREAFVHHSRTAALSRRFHRRSDGQVRPAAAGREETCRVVRGHSVVIDDGCRGHRGLGLDHSPRTQSMRRAEHPTSRGCAVSQIVEPSQLAGSGHGVNDVLSRPPAVTVPTRWLSASARCALWGGCPR